MKKVGSFAVFFETETPVAFRDPEIRAGIVRGLVEKAFPGLWDSLVKEGILVARAGPRLPAGKGYAGLGICTAHPDLFKVLTVALASGISEKFSGEWGSASLARVAADPRSHPFARQISLEAPVSPVPLEGTVELASKSPLRGPFELLGELRRASLDLAGLTGVKDFLPDSELPQWDFLGLEIRPVKNRENLFNLNLALTGHHPYGKTILDFAILKGFGQDKEKGYGHLDYVRAVRSGNP